MALDFPANPSDGDTYTSGGATFEYSTSQVKWIRKSSSDFVTSLDLSSIDQSLLPATTETYDLGSPDNRWADVHLEASTIYIGGLAISGAGGTISFPEGTTIDDGEGGAPEVGSGGGGVSVVATLDDLPSSPSTGDEVFVTGNSKLYLYNGTAWFNIALINQTPTISGADASGELSTEGVATTVTLSATDPEGFPITWSSTTSGTTTAATVTNVDNVFTITPSTDTANAGTISVTFRASDGINVGTATTAFTLLFVHDLWSDVRLNISTNSTDSLDNSTFIDRSTNAHSITQSGNPSQQAFHPYLDNWSVEFDGNGDYLSTPSDATLGLGTGDFTCEFWYYHVSRASTDTMLAPSTSNLNVYINTSGTLGYWDGSVRNSSQTVPLNTWSHIAVVRSSSTIKMYYNGTEVLSEANSINYATTSWLIGVNNTGGSDWSHGYISNLRIVKGTAVYTSAFTPPTENLTAISGTSLLTCQSNRFIDNSINAHAITANGNVAVSAHNPFGQDSEYAVGENKGSLFFNNTGGLDVTSSTDIGTGDFTFQAWIYPLNLSGTKMIISNRGDGGSIFIGTDGTEFYPYVGGSYKTSGAGLRVNEWAHVAFCRTSGSIETYVNGVKYGTVAQGGDLFGSTGYLIGSGDVGQWNGYIADLQVTTTGQYTGNTYTIPTSPVGNTNADLYLPFDNPGIYDKTGKETVTLVGNTVTSTTQTKFADTSIYFDGSGDYLQVPYIALDNNPWTVEMWAYQNSAANVTLMSQGGSSVSAWSLSSSGGLTIQIFRGGNRVLVQNLGSFQTGQWNHCALVCDGTNFTIYLNGVDVGGVATNSTYPWNQSYSTHPLKFGVYDYNNTGHFNGYMEDIQVTTGVAKYTTAFTPPTRTQGRTYQADYS